MFTKTDQGRVIGSVTLMGNEYKFRSPGTQVTDGGYALQYSIVVNDLLRDLVNRRVDVYPEKHPFSLKIALIDRTDSELTWHVCYPLSSLKPEIAEHDVDRIEQVINISAHRRARGSQVLLQPGAAQYRLQGIPRSFIASTERVGATPAIPTSSMSF
jgi:hypothetical protein